MGLKDSNPLEDLEHWEEFVRARYADPAPVVPDARTEGGKQEREFRDYRTEARPSVKEFYRLNHAYQSFDFVRRNPAGRFSFAQIAQELTGHLPRQNGRTANQS